MTLTPQQETAAAELLSRGTGMNCFDEAVILISTIANLIEQGERPIDIIRWLTMLPRVKDKAAALSQAPMPDPRQLSLVSPVSTLPATMQHAMRPPIPGAAVDQRRSAAWLTDPSDAHARSGSFKRRGRPASGTCVECGTEFEMNPVGRPATKCIAHRHRRRQEPAA